MAVPVLEDVSHALAQNRRDEETAIEQNRVGTNVTRLGQEGGQMLGDGRIALVGQARLAKQTALVVRWPLGQFTERQKAFERQLERFFAGHLGFQRAADQ